MTAIVSITTQGNALAKEIHNFMPASVCYTLEKWNEPKFELIEGRLGDYCKFLFQHHKELIFIMATGIVVRCIAPYLQNKTIDPAVIVIDEKGKNIISLLSGHIGGANKLTLYIAQKLNANPVITTSSDINNIESVDMLAIRHNLKIDCMQKAKQITAMLVNAEKVAIIDDCNILHDTEIPENNKPIDGAIVISNKKSINLDVPYVKLIPQNIILGLGCKKNTSPQVLIDFVEKSLIEINIDKQSIKSIATIELKANEQAILDLCKLYNINLKCFDVETLQTVEHFFEGSDFVKTTTGVSAVSETSAFIGGNKNGKFLIKKKIYAGITLSVFLCNN
jgi:cobalt-precorrin 5A hydrolase